MSVRISPKKAPSANKSIQDVARIAPKYVLVKKKNFVEPVEQRECKTCGESFDLTRDFFGSTPTGNLRWQCRSCMRNHVKHYSTNNPNAAKNRADLRKERQAGQDSIDDKTKNFLLKKYKNQCAYCGVSLAGGFHVDHIQPVAKNGTNSINNLAVCCAKCNLAKHAKTAEEFYTWMELRKIKYRLPKLM